MKENQKQRNNIVKLNGNKSFTNNTKILVKLLVVILGYSIFLILKNKKLHNPVYIGNKYDFALDELFDWFTKYLSQNLISRNLTIIYSALWLDTIYLFFLTIYIFRGKGYRECLAFALFYGCRAIFMIFFEFDYPKVNLHEDPGFFSFVAPHGRAPDFFYSGHTGFAFLCSLFILEYKHYYLFILGLFVTILQVLTILITRAHYVIDAYIGFIASHYFYMVSPIFGRIFNKIVPLHND